MKNFITGKLYRTLSTKYSYQLPEEKNSDYFILKQNSVFMYLKITKSNATHISQIWFLYQDKTHYFLFPSDVITSTFMDSFQEI